MSKWNGISDVEMMVMNQDAARELRGWRYVRLEYFSPDVMYSERECGMWIPNTLDRDKFFGMLNTAVKELVSNFEKSILDEIKQWEDMRDNPEPPKFVTPEQRTNNCNLKISQLKEDLENFRERYGAADNNDE